MGDIAATNQVGFLQKGAFQWTLLLAIFFGTIIFIFILNYNFQKDFLSYMDITEIDLPEKKSSVRVTIDFGDGKKRAFEGDLASQVTGAEALRLAQEVGGFSLKIALSGEVTEIDKVKSQNGKKWSWYLNGEISDKPIPDVAVRGGDKVLLKYE